MVVEVVGVLVGVADVVVVVFCVSCGSCAEICRELPPLLESDTEASRRLGLLLEINTYVLRRFAEIRGNFRKSKISK